MQAFDFKEFWQALSSEEKKQLAAEAGTTVYYIRTHLVYKTRVPGRKRMTSLYNACSALDPKINKDQFVSFFYSAA